MQCRPARTKKGGTPIAPAGRIFYWLVAMEDQDLVFDSDHENLFEALDQGEIHPFGTLEAEHKSDDRSSQIGEVFTSAKAQ